MRRPARRWLCAVLTTAVALTTAFLPLRSALAWGRKGHRASARLAESRLSPSALAAVRELLEKGESLADASTWADEVRTRLPMSGPWHYVNVPIGEPHFNPRFCPKEGCVVSKLDDFAALLADRHSPRAERQQALRFLVHFVQDVHQPLHVGDRKDRGGNDTQVRFFEKGSNLHKVWDSDLFDRLHDEASLLDRITGLADLESSRGWASTSTEDWADESLQAARRAYVLADADEPLRSGSQLGAEYLSVHLPVAERRLAQSGVRLAEVLNGVFDDTE
jgi:nuclease S1